ncbi:MAG: hypothetical protein NC124_11490 [Clostridium sp.]|nr:hypothetical protein [Clostridium sp.]
MAENVRNEPEHRNLFIETLIAMKNISDCPVKFCTSFVLPKWKNKITVPLNGNGENKKQKTTYLM